MNMKKGGRKFVTFVVCLIVVYFVAGLGSLFTTSGTRSQWYESVRPALTPSNYVFPIVWTILFFLIGVSLFFSWINAKNVKMKKKVALVFGINFILNILWSVFYFGIHNPLLAFMDIILLIVSVVWMMIVCWKISKTASWLLLPYLLWISFASILNWLSI